MLAVGDSGGTLHDPGSSMEPQSPLHERGQLFSSLHACMHTQTDAHTHSGPPHIEAIYTFNLWSLNAQQCD